MKQGVARKKRKIRELPSYLKQQAISGHIWKWQGTRFSVFFHNVVLHKCCFFSYSALKDIKLENHYFDYKKEIFLDIIAFLSDIK